MDHYLFIVKSTGNAPVAVRECVTPDYISYAHGVLDNVVGASLALLDRNFICCCEVWQLLNPNEMKKVITVF